MMGTSKMELWPRLRYCFLSQRERKFQQRQGRQFRNVEVAGVRQGQCYSKRNLWVFQAQSITFSTFLVFIRIYSIQSHDSSVPLQNTQMNRSLQFIYVFFYNSLLSQTILGRSMNYLNLSLTTSKVCMACLKLSIYGNQFGSMSQHISSQTSCIRMVTRFLMLAEVLTLQPLRRLNISGLRMRQMLRKSLHQICFQFSTKLQVLKVGQFSFNSWLLWMNKSQAGNSIGGLFMKMLIRFRISFLEIDVPKGNFWFGIQFIFNLSRFSTIVYRVNYQTYGLVILHITFQGFYQNQCLNFCLKPLTGGYSTDPIKSFTFVIYLSMPDLQEIGKLIFFLKQYSEGWSWFVDIHAWPELLQMFLNFIKRLFSYSSFFIIFICTFQDL